MDAVIWTLPTTMTNYIWRIISTHLFIHHLQTIIESSVLCLEVNFSKIWIFFHLRDVYEQWVSQDLLVFSPWHIQRNDVRSLPIMECFHDRFHSSFALVMSFRARVCAVVIWHCSYGFTFLPSSSLVSCLSLPCLLVHRDIVKVALFCVVCCQTVSSIQQY